MTGNDNDNDNDNDDNNDDDEELTLCPSPVTVTTRPRAARPRAMKVRVSLSWTGARETQSRPCRRFIEHVLETFFICVSMRPSVVLLSESQLIITESASEGQTAEMEELLELRIFQQKVQKCNFV